MNYSSEQIAKAVRLRQNGATLTQIEAALGFPAACKGAKARDLLKATEGQVRGEDGLYHKVQ